VNAFDIGMLAWVVSMFVVLPLTVTAVTLPHVVPWGERGRAARKVAALECWLADKRSVGPLLSRARGYFAARDYVGVESAYGEARRIVDGEASK
jgi:hypothetical protein